GRNHSIIMLFSMLQGKLSKEDASEESMANSRQVIGINFCGSMPLILRVDDLNAARELGIIGTLVGVSEGTRSQAPSDGAVRDCLEALDHSFSFPHTAMAVQLCTARARLSRCALFAGRRLAHTTGREVRVFRDLRRQGFYITSAGKFVGDYLVYPGDPLRFHARFMAVCVSMDDSMPLCDVLAIARLGSNDDDREEVVYTSLQWSGIV
uniref:tRNA-intron lyase n=1 Tax=Hucho hucho TaxID=62062 RepID=A0A4W5KEN0_9TELE